MYGLIAAMFIATIPAVIAYNIYKEKSRIEEENEIYDVFARIVHVHDVELIEVDLFEELKMARIVDRLQQSSAETFIAISEGVADHMIEAGPNTDISEGRIDDYSVKVLEVGQPSLWCKAYDGVACSECQEPIEGVPYRVTEAYIRHDYHQDSVARRFDVSMVKEVNPFCKSCQLEIIDAVDITQKESTELLSAYV